MSLYTMIVDYIKGSSGGLYEGYDPRNDRKSIEKTLAPILGKFPGSELKIGKDYVKIKINKKCGVKNA